MEGMIAWRNGTTCSVYYGLRSVAFEVPVLNHMVYPSLNNYLNLSLAMWTPPYTSTLQCKMSYADCATGWWYTQQQCWFVPALEKVCSGCDGAGSTYLVCLGA